MRLTHIKLAGFKSFVDPTVIPVPGQLVAVVGPNGCGKSNVIDAVRWVLGESQAKHLRGETMQDVIFAGSATRKPVGRASVELVFDNSLGRASGQWTQYAEISVKRILTRNGDSSYYVNNLHVRRRDVTDIFLGTGLGARAYGIIEQGMISRIIEAKPEEIRIFLEEAAGVSKYKERRRETESRLSDTRENLLRVDDIRRELEAQLEKLTGQAHVAQQYHMLQDELRTAQNLLSLLKKYEASAQRERFQKDIQRLVNELEAETARMRETEKRLEDMRAQHYTASDAVHAAQGELYAANAEAAQVEQRMRTLREGRSRLEAQIATLKNQLAQSESQRQGAIVNFAHWEAELTKAKQQVAESAGKLAAEKQELPEAEEAQRQTQRRVAELQRSLSEAEQAHQVEDTHRAHAIRTLQQLASRQQRLAQEKQSLPQPDTATLEKQQAELSGLENELAETSQKLETAQQGLPPLEEARRTYANDLQSAQQQVTRLEAQRHALEQLQAKLGSDEKLKSWLVRHGLEALPRLWQGLTVEPGWEDAVESVLRERLNAVRLDSLSDAEAWLSEAAPARLAVFENLSGDAQAAVSSEGLLPLMRLVHWQDGTAPACMADWLSGIYYAESAAQAMRFRAKLSAGAAVVCREGHIFTRSSLTFYAPQSELHGVLARQREIEQLLTEHSHQMEMLVRQKEALRLAEEGLQRSQTEVNQLRGRASELRQRQHALQMDTLKLAQLVERVSQRGEQIQGELAEIGEQIEAENEQKVVSEDNLFSQQEQIDDLKEHLEDARQERTAADQHLNGRRASLQAAERVAQEAVFFEKTCHIKIAEIRNNIQVLDENCTGLKTRLESDLTELQNLDEAPLQESLQQSLAVRQEREQALALARDYLEGVGNTLRETEQERLRIEQNQPPLREKLEGARLKEQEARLNETQFAEQLQTADADEAALSQTLQRGTKPAVLQAEIERLNQAIAELGAVNLAALEELTTSQERKQYLDAQAADLNEAIETLESAIRRIDKETRDRLQDTFDTVNKHMGELFPSLFGGGEARLVLTGEEILDAGIQIIAQPPGKKNSSIHLLSGGEKALTALSLVFALFRLNPAPFCLLDEVDAPLDDTNTVRFCELVKKMSDNTQFLYISHNKITMEMAHQLVGVTMQEQGVSRVVAVDVEEAMKLSEEAA